MPSIAQLNIAVNSIEAKASIHVGNLNETGLWLRYALAVEQLRGSSTAANASVLGYMLRTAVALEAIAGTSGAEENVSYEGYFKRIVDALEVQAGAVGTGNRDGRFVVASAAAVFGGGDVYGRAYEEALITPTPSSLRSTYNFGGQTLIMSDPSWTGADVGPYWPCVLLKDQGHLPSNYPVDAMVYYSTDHSTGAGGISVLVGMRDAGEPTLFKWLDYSAAKTAGWFNSIATKPATDYLFNVSTKQAETPWVYWDSGTNTWVCYYQVSGSALLTLGGATYRGQATCKATSTNGLQWTLNNVAVLQVPTTEAIGDGHTGYFRMGPNIFPDVPFAYVGYSLAAGSGAGRNAQWGASSPAGPWTLISILGRPGGRALDTTATNHRYKWTELDPRSIRLTRQGYTGVMGADDPTSGSLNLAGRPYEVLLASDGRSIIGQPIEILAPSGVSAQWNEVNVMQPAIIDDAANNRRLVIFKAGTNTPSEINSLGLASGDLRNPGNTYFNALSPTKGTGAETSFDIDFTALGALPASLTQVLTGTGSYTVGASGLSLSIDPTTGVMLFFENNGFIPNTVAYADVFVDDTRSQSTNQYTRFLAGFATAKSNTGTTQPDATRLASSASTTSLALQDFTGTTAITNNSIANHGGIPRGAAQGGRRWSYGLRWFPNSRLGMLLDEDQEGEGQVSSLRGTLNLATRQYPFFGYTALQSGETTLLTIRRVLIRWKLL